MISEIDVRDWDNVKPERALQSLDNLKEAAGSIVFYDDYHLVKEFIRQVELIRRKQVKQIPVLFTRAVDYEPN